MILLAAALTLAPAIAPSIETDTTTPHGAVEASIQALRRNDIAGFLSTTWTKQQIEEARQAWKEAQKDGPSAEQDAQFRATMAMLTAPDAEEQIMEMINPKLEEMKPQIAMFTGMITGMGQSAIQQNQDMSDEEKAQATQILGSVVKLIEENDVTDPARARKAVGIVCDTARKLELRSLQDVQKLTFDQLLRKGNVIFAGSKRLLSVYGAHVDNWLDSVKVETISENGDTATVRITYQILDSKQTVDAEMIRVDGRWLRKETYKAAEKLGALR